jgi:hypothetical protein
MPDPDLVAFLKPLGGVNAAPVEPGAVGRTEVCDVPEAVGGGEAGMMVGGEFVADDERALAPGYELGVEVVSLVPDLDVQRLCRSRLGDGLRGLAGDGGHRGPPGLLLLLAGVFPGWEGSGVSAAMGFVGSLRKAFKAGTGHISMMPEKDATRPGPGRGQIGRSKVGADVTQGELHLSSS